jgi:hypothetical protein
LDNIAEFTQSKEPIFIGLWHAGKSTGNVLTNVADVVDTVVVVLETVVVVDETLVVVCNHSAGGKNGVEKTELSKVKPVLRLVGKREGKEGGLVCVCACVCVRVQAAKNALTEEAVVVVLVLVKLVVVEDTVVVVVLIVVVVDETLVVVCTREMG